MGWKNIKIHFDIGHIVQVEDGLICIGSSYVSKLATIDVKSWAVAENSVFSGFLKEHYPVLLETTPDILEGLYRTADQFEKSIPVFTYDDDGVVELLCEELGWPNVTHDGRLMYNNSFYADRLEALKAARENAGYCVKHFKEKVTRLEEELVEARKELVNAEDKLEKINSNKHENV